MQGNGPSASVPRRIVVAEPRVIGREVLFRWLVDPPSALYREERFRMRFPDGLALDEVPRSLLWVCALLCLHPQWALLRPCRVELPVTLPPGEREFWLRVIDAAVSTLEFTRGTEEVERCVEIVESGPQLERPNRAGGEGFATAFSGGKDSLFSLGLLLELGFAPTAVAITAPLPGMADHVTERRRYVLHAAGSLDRVELIEVESDLRSAWDHMYSYRLGYSVSVGELTDTHLYLAATVVVAWLRGRRWAVLASEAEVQETDVVSGRIVQHPHFMYSGATQAALDSLLSGYGIRHGSLSYPIHGHHAEQLLWRRYPQLRELQYSCWRVSDGEAACSGCSDCLRIALRTIGHGSAPGRVGIDGPRLLLAMGDWRPQAEPPATPEDRVKAAIHGDVVRQVAELPTPVVARAIVGERRRRAASPRTAAAIAAYARMRRRLNPLAEPDPGYRRAYLELVPEPVRERAGAIYDQSFGRAPEGESAELLARTRELAGWIAEPLEAAR